MRTFKQPTSQTRTYCTLIFVQCHNNKQLLITGKLQLRFKKKCYIPTLNIQLIITAQIICVSNRVFRSYTTLYQLHVSIYVTFLEFMPLRLCSVPPQAVSPVCVLGCSDFSKCIADRTKNTCLPLAQLLFVLKRISPFNKVTYFNQSCSASGYPV